MSAVKSYFKEECNLRMAGLDYSKSSDFYLSCWQRTRSPVPLLIWRALLFLSSVGIVLASMILYILAGKFGFWFIYLTHWGLTAITLVTGFSTWISARCYLYGPINAEFNLPWYVKTYWVLYNIAVPLAFLITIFYWTLLYEAGIDEEMNHALDVAIHGVNSILMFLLVISSAHPSRLLHALHPFLFALVYVIFGVIYHLAGGVDQFGNAYIYIVVDWTKPGPTIGVVILTGVLLILLHFIIIGLATLRDLLAKRYVNPAAQTKEELPLRQTV